MTKQLKEKRVSNLVTVIMLHVSTDTVFLIILLFNSEIQDLYAMGKQPTWSRVCCCCFLHLEYQ